MDQILLFQFTLGLVYSLFFHCEFINITNAIPVLKKVIPQTLSCFPCFRAAAFTLYFLTPLKRKCFEADNSAMQLEMDMPPRQTPPSVQPPFNSPFPTVDLQADPSFMVEQWEDQKQSCCLQSRSHASSHCFLPLKVEKEKNALFGQHWAHICLSSVNQNYLKFYSACNWNSTQK